MMVVGNEIPTVIDARAENKSVVDSIDLAETYVNRIRSISQDHEIHPGIYCVLCANKKERI
jgi:hypothetical protein